MAVVLWDMKEVSGKMVDESCAKIFPASYCSKTIPGLSPLYVQIYHPKDHHVHHDSVHYNDGHNVNNYNWDIQFEYAARNGDR